ncbi:MAG: hemerythrin domain-containing protein [Candidatus Eisenbacteria bacterium]
MSRDPIERLLAEHVTLMARLAPLRRTLEALRESAAEPDEAQLAVLRDGAHVLTTDLIAHARREDDVFFPAVEAAIGGAFGPTSVMRREHADIHDGADRFRATLHELHEVQHPAIVAGGERLTALVQGDAADAGVLRVLGAQLLDLIDGHFAKEEQILFPMSRNLLGTAGLEQVARELDAFDAH